MRAGTMGRGATVRPAKSLVVRGGLARTFGSLISFLAVMFLCFGFYLLEDVFANPLAAQAVGVIAGAFIVALAAILLFYLFKPRNRSRARTDRFTRGE